MPPTLVNAAFGALLAAALLGPAFDRRAVAVVVTAAVVPDLDAVASLLLAGATNAALHNLFVPAIAAGVVHWDLAHREQSWLRSHYGWRGGRIAWVAIASLAVAGIGLDLFSSEAVNLLYPLHDRFYAIVGWFVISTQDGIVQTYVTLDPATIVEIHSAGTTADYHVPTWVNPAPGTDTPPDADRRLRVLESGWQAVVVAAATATLAIRFWGDR